MPDFKWNWVCLPGTKSQSYCEDTGIATTNVSLDSKWRRTEKPSTLFGRIWMSQPILLLWSRQQAGKRQAEGVQMMYKWLEWCANYQNYKVGGRHLRYRRELRVLEESTGSKEKGWKNILMASWWEVVKSTECKFIKKQPTLVLLLMKQSSGFMLQHCLIFGEKNWACLYQYAIIDHRGIQATCPCNFCSF